MRRTGRGGAAPRHATLLLLILLSSQTIWLTPSAHAQSSDCGDGQPSGRFPVLIVHGFNQQPGNRRWFGAVDRTISASGASPHYFDYGGSTSRQWVTDPDIAPRLVSTLACLSEQSRQAGGPGQVGVVAHSMGGLAVRAALATSDGAVLHGDRVAFVASVATPHDGAFFDRPTAFLGDWLAGKLLPACRADTTSWFCDLASVAASPAAQAMAQGSPQLAQLPWFPDDVPVHLVGGQITACNEVFGYAGSCSDVNDPLVPLSSSMAQGHPTVASSEKTACKTSYASFVLGLRNELEDVSCSHGAIMLGDTTTEAVHKALDGWIGPPDPTAGERFALMSVDTSHSPPWLATGLFLDRPTDPAAGTGLAHPTLDASTEVWLRTAKGLAVSSPSSLPTYLDGKRCPSGFTGSCVVFYVRTEGSAITRMVEAPAEPSQARGPANCGTVHSSITNNELTVSVVSGSTTCEEAKSVVDTYYNDPPTTPQGSGGAVQVGRWACISTSGAEFAATGHAGACTSGTDQISIDGSSASGPPSTQPSPAVYGAPAAGAVQRTLLDDVNVHTGSAKSTPVATTLKKGTIVYARCWYDGEPVPEYPGATWIETTVESRYILDTFLHAQELVPNCSQIKD